MSGMVKLLITSGLLILLLAVSSAQLAENVSTAATETAIVNISVDCYPHALPNDGQSEAEINITVTDDNGPLVDQKVVAEITAGDGTLYFEEANTDTAGVVSFPFRSGLMPEKTEIVFRADGFDTEETLDIPLAPVTYLDVLLVTPEDYAAYLSRQASAAPIYKLSATVFPDQLAADDGSIADISAQLLNSADGTPAVGVPLVAAIVSGSGTLEFEQVATDSDGNFSFMFIAGNEPGTTSVMITEPSTGLIVSVDILLVEAGPARVHMFYLDPIADRFARKGAILPADGITGIPVVAEITDLSGIPLSGIELKIEIMKDENGWIEIIDPVSDIAGRVEFVYHAGTTVGDVRLRSFIMNTEDISSGVLLGI